jgi:hypothetical protein
MEWLARQGWRDCNHQRQSQGISIAAAGRCFYKLVPDTIAEAECVEHILPIGTAKDECFAIFGLPLIDHALRIPPRVEMDTLDASQCHRWRQPRYHGEAAGQ